MKSKYETIRIDQAEIIVDVSLLAKTDELFFNATQIAKPFGKKPDDFLRLKTTKEYIREILEESQFGNSRTENLIRIQNGGKYKGTWLHNELAFEFAGWCSASFRRKLHKWAENRIQEEHNWQQKRLEAKTGFLPMTAAILHAHDPAKHYHYSNEADLINRIVLGMSAREFRLKHEVNSIRDVLDESQLKELNRLQIINTGLLEIGMSYHERKEKLIQCHQKQIPPTKISPSIDTRIQ